MNSPYKAPNRSRQLLKPIDVALGFLMSDLNNNFKSEVLFRRAFRNGRREDLLAPARTRRPLLLLMVSTHVGNRPVAAGRKAIVTANATPTESLML